MSLLTTLVLALAVVAAFVHVVRYFGGYWLVNLTSAIRPLPEEFTGLLPPDSPPVRVVGGDALSEHLAAVAGPPWSRTVLLNETLLDVDPPRFRTVTTLSTHLIRSHAHDSRAIANLVRFELLFGVMWFAFWAAKHEEHQTPLAALATIIAILGAVIGAFYLLYRLVASRVYLADEETARAVGVDALVEHLRSKDNAPATTLRAVVQLTPTTDARIDRLRANHA